MSFLVVTEVINGTDPWDCYLAGPFDTFEEADWELGRLQRHGLTDLAIYDEEHHSIHAPLEPPA